MTDKKIRQLFAIIRYTVAPLYTEEARKSIDWHVVQYTTKAFAVYIYRSCYTNRILCVPTEIQWSASDKLQYKSKQ